MGIEEEINLEALANEENQDQEQQEENQLSDFEKKQFDEGWRPLEDFNGPEENWKTAKEFHRDGEWIDKLNNLKSQIDTQQQQFDSRLENSNRLHKARKQSEIKALKAEQREAVLVSDAVKYDLTQEQIDELENQKIDENPSNSPKDPSIAAWETKNPWINDNNDERVPVTQAIWNSYIQQNPAATTQQAIAHIDDRLGKLYPANNNNPRRDQPNTTENNRRPSKRQGNSLSMSDLSTDERQEWDLYGSQMFLDKNGNPDEKLFLKTIADTRKK